MALQAEEEGIDRRTVGVIPRVRGIMEREIRADDQVIIGAGNQYRLQGRAHPFPGHFHMQRGLAVKPGSQSTGELDINVLDDDDRGAQCGRHG